MNYNNYLAKNCEPAATTNGGGQKEKEKERKHFNQLGAIHCSHFTTITFKGFTQTLNSSR